MADISRVNSPSFQQANFKVNQEQEKPKVTQQKVETPSEAPKVNKKADFDRAKAEVLGAAPDAGKATRNETTSTVNALTDETAKVRKASVNEVASTKGSSETVVAKKQSSVENESKMFKPAAENAGAADEVEEKNQKAKADPNADLANKLQANLAAINAAQAAQATPA